MLTVQVHIGTKNAAKVAAVREAVTHYERQLFAALAGSAGKVLVVEHQTESGVAANPLGFDETLIGARNRASAAVAAAGASPAVCLGVGLESGFVQFSRPRNAVFNFDVCCIVHEDREHFGFSNGTEYPFTPIQNVLDRGAPFAAETGKHLQRKPLDDKEGYLGVLTDGEYTRLRVCEIAVRHAFLRLLHAGDYY